MKALIISDKQEVTSLLQNELQEKGFDTIVYKWFLKALDNIEEIQPDLIVLNVEEYPRHWKTLTSFVQSGIGGNEVRVILYNSELLSSEDKEKAEKLGVEFYVDSKDVEIQSVETEAVDVDVDVEESEVVPTVEDIINENKTFSVVLTNPANYNFVYGTAEKLSADTFECEINNEGFEVDQTIKYTTLCDSNSCINFSSEVLAISSKKVMIKVINYYEN